MVSPVVRPFPSPPGPPASAAGKKQVASKDKSSSIDPPAGGGDDGGMEARVTALETKWDAVIPTLVTKADVEGLRTEVHKGFADMVKWIVGTSVLLGVAGITVMTFVLNNAVPKAPPAAAVVAPPAPIIINVPPAPQAAEPQQTAKKP